MIGLILVYVDVLFTCGECGFNSFQGVGPILGNGCGIQGQKYVTLFQGSEMSAG